MSAEYRVKVIVTLSNVTPNEMGKKYFFIIIIHS
jgi:hypothetical protein